MSDTRTPHGSPTHSMTGADRRPMPRARGSIQLHADTFSTSVAPAIDWHEVTNIGSTPLRYILIDPKYKTPKQK